MSLCLSTIVSQYIQQGIYIHKIVIGSPSDGTTGAVANQVIILRGQRIRSTAIGGNAAQILVAGNDGVFKIKETSYIGAGCIVDATTRRIVGLIAISHVTSYGNVVKADDAEIEDAA